VEENKRNIKFLSGKLLYYGIIALVVSTAVFSAYFIIKNFDVGISYVAGIVNKFLSAIAPLILGIIFAYLFNRPVMFFEKIYGKLKIRRGLSIATLYILIFGTISLAINFIVPGIQRNLTQLIYADLPNYSSAISSNFTHVMDFLKSLGITIDFNNLQSYIIKATSLSSTVLDGIMSLVKSVTQGVFNFALAMILAFYILQRKEKLLDGIKEFILLYGGKKIRTIILTEARGFNSILNNYISGVLIDVIIVIVLATIGLSIVGHRYFLLMGVMIGILNLIPYFGAIIGVAVACLLALFQGLPTAVYSLITLLVIQQIDGNIIQPKIVGGKVGLEPLWVITAVIVFGSYWGIWGMLVAVPVTALIKALFKKMISKRREAVNKAQADEDKK
jgi:predicted PurR-regulated permease PerM